MSHRIQPAEKFEFVQFRRDRLLSYEQYAARSLDEIETFEIVNASLIEHSRRGKPDPSGLMIASRRRAWDALEHLHIEYSGGAPVAYLKQFFKDAVVYWKEYATFNQSFDRTSSSPYTVAHLTLQDAGYWNAIRLTSFAALLSNTDDLKTLSSIWDYSHQTLDGLLERLVAPYVPGRPPPPDKCTRHLPYVKLLNVFTAEPSKRPFLMAKYMDDWYEASRREPYYRSHTRGREHSYLGYWSFEAAAVTIVLDIDDSIYRDKDFYPKDLADFARSTNLQANHDGSTSTRSIAVAPTNV